MHCIAHPSFSVSESEQSRKVTPKQVAETCRVHVSTVYRLIRRGRLAAYRRGRFIHLDADEVSAAFRAATHVDQIEAYVDRVVAQAPSLTSDQLSRLATLLDANPVSPADPPMTKVSVPKMTRGLPASLSVARETVETKTSKEGDSS